MKKINLNLETEMYVNLDTFSEKELSPIINICAFTQLEDEPLYSLDVSFEEILDMYIEENSIPNGEINSKYTLNDKYRKHLLDGFESLKKIIDEKIKYVEKIPEWKMPK